MDLRPGEVCSFMKKLMWTISIALLLVFGFTACGPLPDEPTADTVLQDAKTLASSLFLGETKGTDEKFLLNSLLFEDTELTWVEDNETRNAEITAFIGDEKWKSEAKQTLTVHYELNATRQWEAQGVSVNNPVIRVISRK
jgi:hypothetical protein